MINYHNSYWKQFQSGSQGISGKKTVNAMTMFNQLFEVTQSELEFEDTIEDTIEDSDELMNDVLLGE